MCAKPLCHTHHTDVESELPTGLSLDMFSFDPLRPLDASVSSGRHLTPVGQMVSQSVSECLCSTENPTPNCHNSLTLTRTENPDPNSLGLVVMHGGHFLLTVAIGLAH